MIVAGYHYWGEKVLTRLRGMFAFVIWDRQERRAFGARDYFGIKPLHYLQTVDGVYLASEKKALLPFAPAAHAGDAGVDTANLSHYLTLQYVPEPGTLHQGISPDRLGGVPHLDAGRRRIEVRRWYRPVFRPAPVDDPQRLYDRDPRDAARERTAAHALRRAGRRVPVQRHRLHRGGGPGPASSTPTS